MYDPSEEKHAESVKKYPSLPLSDGEFVVAQVRRHPIGLFSIWFIDILVVVIIIGLLVVAGQHTTALTDAGITVSSDLLLGAAMLLVVLALLFGWIGATIYSGNQFYVSNESVFQYVRTGLFSNREQIIALSAVEDASYHQDGIIQYMLGYGSIRLSTVGDETTYRFTLVENPQTQLRTLNEAVEAFKRRERNNTPPPAPAVQTTDKPA